MKKLIVLILTAATLFVITSQDVSAEIKNTYAVYVNGTPNSALSNGSFRDGVKIKGATVKAGFDIYGVYVIFTETPSDMTVCFGNESIIRRSEFLHEFIDVSSSPESTISVSFGTGAKVAEIAVYGEEIPDSVQRWDTPCENADLLLCTTHADDEQLFFAGLLPYYAGERGFDVQVVYFTDHKNEPRRRHELLDGLWTAGVRHYPVIGILPDEYSRNKDPDAACEWAVKNAKSHGISEDDLIAFQTEQIRRFKPLIAVCHDLRGEYGHGQHILNVRTFLSAAEKSADPGFCTESAEKYGVWDVKKIYVHLYTENAIVMDWDVPLDSFDGLTAFQVSQKGFKCHTSQQSTWFADWIYGTDRKQTRAKDIRVDPYKRSDCYYSPCNYGLYRSTVGEDVLKNDLAENIETYKEKAAREEAEQKRLEEESRIAESESIRIAEESESLRIYESESVSAAEESIRIYESESVSVYESESVSAHESEEESRREYESESIRIAEESRKAAGSESERIADEAHKKDMTSAVVKIFAATAIISALIMTAVIVYLKKRRR